MSYTAEINRSNPTCFVFLIDRSGSMSDAIGGGAGKVKADVVADAINRLLQTLILRCAKADGVRDYFHAGVVGYGNQVGPALGGALAGRSLLPVSEIANHPLRLEQRNRKVDDGAGGLIDQTIKFPVWFESVAEGVTPMCEALHQAQQMVEEFTGRFPKCFPPIVLNITDGEATDGDPEPAAAAIRALATTDGKVLLFNLHVSSAAESPMLYPSSDEGLIDDHARMLFRMSSILPEPALDTARREGYSVGLAARGFVFNADVVSVIQFLNIGTRMTRVDWNLQR
jgi:hypothetical protein